MSASPPDRRPDVRRSLERDVRSLERRRSYGSIFWRSLAVLGTVGWSIALPAAGGALLGHHLDERFQTGVHFTLVLLSAGVLLGSAVAWRVLQGHRE